MTKSKTPTSKPEPKTTRATKQGAAAPEPAATPTAAAKPPRQTKAALLRARLSEPGGVSLGSLMTATGWQSHTVRAALTGLRNTGLTITRRREGSDTIYAIETGETAPKVTENAEDRAEGAPPDSASALASAGTTE